MQLLVLVTKECERLDDLLRILSNAGVSGATILDCEGMAERLIRAKNKDEIPFFELFAEMLLDGNVSGKMVLMVLHEEQLERARCIIREFSGGLEKPNTGIMFGVPLSFTEGIRF